MSCCLPGAYDTANIFLWHDCYDEQDFSSIHTEALNSLLVIIEPVVKNFDLARIILKRPCCGRETDTVLREIRCRFGFVPFIFHMLDTTGYQYYSSNGMRQKGGLRPLWRRGRRYSAVLGAGAYSGVDWRATVDEDGHYAFAVAL